MTILIRTSDVPPAQRHEAWRSIVCVSGRAHLRQDGRSAQLSRGEFTIYDFNKPYELGYDSAVQLAVFSFPRAMLALPAALTARLTAVPVTAAGGAAALAVPLLRIHAFIEQHLGDADLTPGLVAAAHYISVRYLYRLFDTQGTTVASWIRQRRLERCRRDLADPALDALPVSAIAARWGLPDAAHFSRLFRRTYGQPPAEYRRLRLLPSA